MRELLIATRNAGKLREMRELLKGLPFTLRGLHDIPSMGDFEPEETGATFEENAIIKVKEYGERAGMLTLADDSGLSVDALRGEPGIRSARYAPGSDADRYMKLLDALKDVSDEQRTAHFTASIAIYDPATGKLRTCAGVCAGRIMREPKGEEGFGYDPVFFPDELGARFAEVPMERKLTVDHRGRAIQKAREILLAEFA